MCNSPGVYVWPYPVSLCTISTPLDTSYQGGGGGWDHTHRLSFYHTPLSSCTVCTPRTHPCPVFEAVRYGEIQRDTADTARYVRIWIGGIPSPGDRKALAAATRKGVCHSAPWSESLRYESGTCSPPLVYFWDIPPVLHLYPACISPYPWYPVYPCIDLYLAILQQIHCISLYPTVSSCIRRI